MKLFKHIFISILTILLCISNPIQATNASIEDLSNKKFDKILTDNYYRSEPGCSVLVAQQGKIIYQKAIGKADMELNIPLKPNMLFRIGSITKQFTSIAILQLVEKGKINLQDDIRKYIKDYPTKGYKITIEHLLTHTSGIKSYTSIIGLSSNEARLDRIPKEVIELFKNEPMDFVPGTKFLYNNSGYFLLGYIIEIVSGLTYQNYLETNIFKPLGLKNISYDSPSKLIINRAKGYQPTAFGYENASFLSMSFAYSAGALLSDTEDLFSWNRSLFQYKLVKEETLELALKSYKLMDGKDTGYGYGWFIGFYKGRKVYSHGGGINGFFTFEMYIPAEDIYITVLNNKTAGEPYAVCLKIADVLLVPLKSLDQGLGQINRIQSIQDEW